MSLSSSFWGIGLKESAKDNIFFFLLSSFFSNRMLDLSQQEQLNVCSGFGKLAEASRIVISHFQEEASESHTAD